MNKFLSILAIILVLLFVFASCKNKENANNDITTPEETTTTAPEETHLPSEGLDYEVNDGYVKLNNLNNIEVQNILKVVIIQLKSVEDSYSKHIKIVESYQ